MIRSHLRSSHLALAFAATMLLSAGAVAQSAHAAPPGKANAAPEAQKAGDAPQGKPGQPGDKPQQAMKADKDGKEPGPAAADPTKGSPQGDLAARRTAQREAQRAELQAAHAPMSEAVREELRRNARRVARLERIRALALEAKDTATVERTTKLLDKERARHGKWLSNLAEAHGKPETNGKAEMNGKADPHGKTDPSKADPSKADPHGKADNKGGAR